MTYSATEKWARQVYPDAVRAFLEETRRFMDGPLLRVLFAAKDEPRDSPLLGSDAKHTPGSATHTTKTQPVHVGPELGVFSGVGAFTYGSPEVVLPHLDVLDWVAVLPVANPYLVEQLHAGTRVMVWETGQGDLQGQRAVDALGAVGYIGQAESEDQLSATIHAIYSMLVPVAIVSNVTSLGDWPADDIPCLTEAYENANPNATILGLDYEARKRGATLVAPCFGIYHEGDPGSGGYVAKLPLQHYLSELAFVASAAPSIGTSFSFWIAEQLDDVDWAALTEWRAARAKTAA